MIPILRAFVWLRWRLLINAFKGGRRRDSLEMVSRGGSIVFMVIVALFMVPAMLGLGALGLWAGWAMGSANVPSRVFVTLARLLLGGMTAVILVIPVIQSIQTGSTSYTRFMLLPVPKRLLHLIEMLSELADPWIVMIVPALLLVPFGLLFSGAVGAALVAMLAGLLLIAIFVVLSSALSTLLQWIYRSRKRGEVLTLVVLVCLSCSGLVPMIFSHSTEERLRRAHGTERRGADRQAAGEDASKTGSSSEALPPGQSPLGTTGEVPPGGGASGSGGSVEARGANGAPSSEPGSSASGSAEPSGRAVEPPGSGSSPPRATGPDWFWRGVWRWLVALSSALPSEMYVRSVTGGISRDPGALPVLAGMILLLGVLYTSSWVAYRHLLETPSVGAGRSTRRRLGVRTVRFPGLTSAASAVASAHVRGVLRTVQGKMAVYFSPVVMIVLFVAVVRFHLRTVMDLGSGGGPILVWIGVGLSLLQFHKVMVNQFALDGAGLTLQFLAPISARDMVAGKAAGAAVLVVASWPLYFAAGLIAAPGGSPVLWLLPLIGGLAAFLPLAPAAAVLSALFPKTADLNRMGSAGNPNQFAALFGVMCMALFFAPPPLIVLGAVSLAKSPALALVLLAIWTVVAATIAILLTRIAAATLEARRENLAMVAQGR